MAAFARSAPRGWRRRGQFAEVERFCLFLGYPRSGHSLVGSLLNAHPEILVSHELDAVGYVEHHFRRAQLYTLILERDELFASMGRTWTGYGYEVPGQFQGRWTRLRVIGDKRGRDTSFRLGRGGVRLLERVRRVVGVPISVVHVTRDPFDNIATMSRYRHRPRRAGAPAGSPGRALEEAVDRYAELCRWVDEVRRRLAPEELHDLAYEDFVARPEESLAGLCRFLGVEASPSYLSACAGVVWPDVRPTREAVGWTGRNRERVAELVATYPVLSRYGEAAR